MLVRDAHREYDDDDDDDGGGGGAAAADDDEDEDDDDDDDDDCTEWTHNDLHENTSISLTTGFKLQPMTGVQ